VECQGSAGWGRDLKDCTQKVSVALQQAFIAGTGKEIS
jgi:hypothetical protein